MRHMLALESAEASEMQGLTRVSLGADYASFLIGSDRVVEDWDNPLPVAVLLQPVRLAHSLGLLVGQRRIAPFIGEQAFAGGFMRKGESVEQAALRELGEECGMPVSGLGGPRRCHILTSRATENGRLLLFVQNDMHMTLDDVRDLKASDEMERWGVWDGGFELCFPLHQEVGDTWLARNRARGDADNLHFFPNV